MKVLVIGKKGSMTNWVEEALDGFLASRHVIQFCVTQLGFINKQIERLLWPQIAANIKRRIARFDPDLILAICPERMEPTMLKSIASLPNRPPMVGWVGHVIVAEQAPALSLFDALGYTDTAFIDQHRNIGLRPKAGFVPHAADLKAINSSRGGAEPRTELVFVGGACAYRRSVISKIEMPVALYGPAWADRSGVAMHHVVARRIYRRELGKLYSNYIGTLNIKNEGLIVSGLNQRHFTPLALGLVSVTDAQKDLSFCFEPEEILVYENEDQLNDIYKEISRSPRWAREIARKGRDRVLSDHTYAKRLESFAALV